MLSDDVDILLQAAEQIRDTSKGPALSIDLNVNNLRLCIKILNDPTEILITDDDKREIELPTQIYWELRQNIDRISDTFQQIMDKKNEVRFKLHLGADYNVSMNFGLFI